MADSTATGRSFLGLAGGAALFCTIRGERVPVDGPAGVARADALAARGPRPVGARAAAFPEIQPAPGGMRMTIRVR